MTWSMMIGSLLHALGVVFCLVVLIFGWIRVELLCKASPKARVRARAGLALVVFSVVVMQVLRFALSMVLPRLVHHLPPQGTLSPDSVVGIIYAGVAIADWATLAAGLAFLLAAITADRQPCGEPKPK